ncbi:hypothetical protein BMR99_03535 [Propionibacterium freudenreichii]|uniref:Uncharacterized protein n=1 Tax=Propionibacterium freudenreichii TaxID=1744 RepID=A0A509MIB6_9ACTN|nr:hypothetical protein [Propionibacterium freudenreichii]ARO11719.1 hypothetical protein BMR99_03535 [Propionibacterium freudenreichii]SCQ79546.1 Hypothetical protein PFR_JS23_1419 [Propionibacterium freudenreichii]SCQ83204.1 Hypothetical protein PFR_JS23-PH_27 [Propionibacterium freudenreichii]SUY93585.1 Hypothetical protein PFR_JS23-PH_27 [Propionibacterium freudenreichii]
MAEAKKISAAEKARRETQSAKDTGTITDTTVQIGDIELTVPAAVFEDDWEFQEAILMANDPDATDEDRARASMTLFRRLVGNRHREVLDQLRDESGRVPVSKVTETVKKIMDAVNPN